MPAPSPLAVSNAYGAVLCDAYFAASCAWIAQSGLGLIYPGGVTLPELWLTTLGGFVGALPWNASLWVPDGVVINIGEVRGARSS